MPTDFMYAAATDQDIIGRQGFKRQQELFSNVGTARTGEVGSTVQILNYQLSRYMSDVTGIDTICCTNACIYVSFVFTSLLSLDLESLLDFFL